MKSKPRNQILVVATAIFAIYVVAYFNRVERIMSVAFISGVGYETHLPPRYGITGRHIGPLTIKIFSPIHYLDRKFIRREYWEALTTDGTRKPGVGFRF